MHVRVCVCTGVCERMSASEMLSACVSHRPGPGAPHLSETDVCRDPVSDGETHDVPGNQVSSQQVLELSFSDAACETGKSQSTRVSIPALCTLINVSRDGRHTLSLSVMDKPWRCWYFLNSCTLEGVLGECVASGRPWSLSEVQSLPCLPAWTRG